MASKICIVGSSNIDQIAYVDSTPSDGETVFGNEYKMGLAEREQIKPLWQGLWVLKHI